MKPAIITALDLANRLDLVAAIDRLPAELEWFKVGLELFCAEGPAVLEPLHLLDKRIFLDLKLHDIPRTVERAVASVARHNVELLTIHAHGGKAMMSAAAQAAKSTRGSRPLRLLAVTVLTSLDGDDLRDMGIARSPRDHVVALAENAYACGVDGVVCSIHEASAVRKALGPEALIVTPGIRLPGNAAEDQKRIGTPRDALNAGATHLVIGRPIVEAADPRAAVAAVLADLA
jgi:orotidine-5'-phosphate decarboxylase